MRTDFTGMTTREIRETRMYGCTEAALRKSIEDSITFKLSGPMMVAASMLSDAQEMINTEYGEVTFDRAEEARQTINRAKFIMFEVMDSYSKEEYVLVNSDGKEIV